MGEAEIGPRPWKGARPEHRFEGAGTFDQAGFSKKEERCPRRFWHRESGNHELGRRAM